MTVRLACIFVALLLTASVAAAQQSRPHRPHGQTASTPPFESDGLADEAAVIAGIHLRPDGTRVVSRAARDAILGAPWVVREARVVPAEEHGAIVGMRLYGIRPATALAALGFRNGDTIRAVAGYAMGTPERALDAYAHLHTADHVDVDVMRDGRLLTLHFVLAPAA